MAPPLTVGLTGAVASGKSAALEIFGRLGAATISADAVVHELLDSEPMLSRLVERWGAEVVEGGRADRNRIGQIVFADPAELGWLESNIHPLVGDSVATWLAGLDSNCRIAVAEIPLLFEGEMHSVFDTTVTVVSNEALRFERAAARGHALTPEREKLQLSSEEKAARADHVVENHGSLEDLERAVASLMESLLQP